MKYIYLVLISLSISSCVTVSGLTGKYQDRPYEVTTDKDFETVWSEVIDLFSSEGYPIAVVDKNSGLIATQSVSFIKTTTTEKKGRIANRAAYIVSSTHSAMFVEYPPRSVRAQWNVRIKEVNNKTIVSIKIANIESETGYIDKVGVVALDASSTGVFEKKIADIITSGITSTTVSAIVANGNSPLSVNDDFKNIEKKPPLLDEPSKIPKSLSEENVSLTKNADLQSQRILLEKEKLKFDQRQKAHFIEIETKEEALLIREKELDKRELDLIAKESDLKTKLSELNSYKPPTKSVPVSQKAPQQVSDAIAQTSTQPVISKPTRYIQFTATGPNKSFDNVSHLGTVISEHARDNIYRYKVMGQFDDNDVRRVIGELERLGYKGAFEN